MSAQLSRCVAVYSRHFVASRINAPAAVVVFTLAHFVTTQKTMGWTKSSIDRLWSPTPNIRSAIATLRRAARLLFDRPLPAISRAHTARDVDRLSGGVRRKGGGGDFRPVVRVPMAVALPRSRYPVSFPGRFGRATAGYVDPPQEAMGSRHRPETAPGPAGDCPSPFAPPPAIQLRSRM